MPLSNGMASRRFPTLLSVLMAVFSLATGSMVTGQEVQPIELTAPAKAKANASLETSEDSASEKSASQKKERKEQVTDDWRPLLPEEGLEGWEITDFYSKGKVHRDGDLLIIESGDPLNGITYVKKDFPKENFEISLEAKRIEGSDFLCGLTFPVGEEFCSFIAGGWGGGLVGLSSVDGFDASENATTTYNEFENGKWYQFRVRVDPESIRTWVDDEPFFEQERANHKFSTRIEVYASQPLGFCAFQSKVAVRDFKWRPLKQEEKAEQNPSDTDALQPAKPIQ